MYSSWMAKLRAKLSVIGKRAPGGESVLTRLDGSRRQMLMPTGLATGAQALERGLIILREIAGAADRGRRLVELQRITRLTKPTVHRILRALLHYGLVVQDRETYRYFIGPEATILALSAQKSVKSLSNLAHGDLQMLAEETGDTAFLMVRSGNDVVCVDRHMGPYPIKALTGEIGTRRPLGIGAGGIALLAVLAELEIDAILDANSERIRHFPNASDKLIRRAVKEARKRSYSYSDGNVVNAVRGLGVTVRDGNGEVIAALSIGAIRERVNRTRTDALLAALQRARRNIERRLRQSRAQTFPWL